jgi:hypothetical protein
MKHADADASELIAELILSPRHICGPSCICGELRRVPAVEQAILDRRRQLAAARPYPVFPP